MSTALLGSARGSAAAPPQLPELLAPALAASEAETRLLRAAAVMNVVQRAAQVPAVVTADVPPPSPPEDTMQPASEPKLIALLAQLIDEARPLLVIEACRLLAATRRCLPVRLLPRALELGRAAPQLRESLRGVLGKRGGWLAAQNPLWKFAVLAGTETADTRLWEEGDAKQRAAFVAQLRNAKPGDARQLLQDAFPQETARDRAVLLLGLETNLGSADEPFLNDVLAADRSKEVRQVAARLLSRQPDSSFARRMAARLEACVRRGRKLLRGVTVEIEGPPHFAADWKDDALEEKLPSGVKLGERAWWLLQIVSYAPLVWWERTLALSPSDILAIALKSDWRDALFAGFLTAIRTQPDHPQWTAALLEAGVLPHAEAIALAHTLPPAEARAAFRRIFTETDDPSLAALALETANFTWDPALWSVVKERLPAWLGKHEWRFRTAIPVLACRIPPESLREEIVLPGDPFFAEAFADFSRIVAQRRTLYGILQS